MSANNAPAAAPTAPPATVPLYGEGAPKNKNWDEVENAQSVAPDQAYNLPDPATVTLYKITPQLTSGDDFDTWEAMVVKQLRGLQLHNLIDDKVDRPDRNDPYATRWVELSERVSWSRIAWYWHLAS